VVKVSTSGQIWTERRRWNISYALAGQRVEMVRLQDRVLVYHCRTLIRELDLANGGTTTVAHWLTD